LRSVTPQSVLVLAGALILAGSACKKGPKAAADGNLPDEVFATQSEAERVGSVTGQRPARMTALADLYRLPTSALPAWTERCDLFRIPTPPNLPNSDALALACGPHGVLLFAAPEADGLTEQVARNAATEGMREVLPSGASVQATTRAARGGKASVDVLDVDGVMTALVSATVVDGTVIVATCSGPENPHRGTFCDAYVAGFVPGAP